MAEKSPEERAAFYKRLRKKLEEDTSWPSKYLFKFIVPTSKEKIEKIEQFFNNTGAVITKRKSRKGNYTSVSVRVNMRTPERVITKYKEVAQVKGVISL